jgi:molybdenum cofactor biosynthesis protein B
VIVMSHRNHVVERYNVCFVVTSDSVYKGLKPDDIKPIAESIGNICREASLYSYSVVPNNAERIRGEVIKDIEKCEVVIVTGGTGISPRDISVEAIKEIAHRELPGFGEVFRFLSYREIGVVAYLSRASAYIINNAIVFIVPGNPNAVKLALKEVICVIAPHAIYELKRHH